MKQIFAIFALAVLAGCAGPVTNHRALPPTTLQSNSERTPTDTSAAAPAEYSSGLPGEYSAGLPGEYSAGLPGEYSAGLPGEYSAGLPGASFACPGPAQAGTAACTIAINLNIPPNPNIAAASLVPGLHPSDLQDAYALPSQNLGGVVAIVDAYDNPLAESDLAVYRTLFGLPDCSSANGCFRKVNQRGQSGSYPKADVGWAMEIALDLDMVSAACPQCSIVLVEADSALLDDLGASVDTAAQFGAVAISNSYYAVEWANEQVEDVHYRHQGIAITASSGDRGYPSYPAASPYVTSVGGTSLARNGSGWTESPWQYTGHGCSQYVAKPWFQQRLNCTKRSTVDLAAVADPQTGVATYSTLGGGWYVAGGTSVGAPLIAAAYALSGQPAGPGYSYLRWRNFRQIGGSGYNMITGIGSPNGVAGL